MLTIDDLKQLPITGRKTIPSDYLDEMGHMNVMWYTHLFSKATGQVFKMFGLTDAYCIDNDAGAFALECHLRYLAEVRVGKTVTIRSRVIGRSERRMHFMHFMEIEAEGRIAATAEFTCTHINMEVRRSSPLPAHLAKAYDELVEAHNQLDWDPPLCGIMKP